MKNKFDPDMIQKMAQNLAQQHIDKITAGFNGGGPLDQQGEGACSVNPQGAQQEQPPQQRRMPTQEQMKLTRDNMQHVLEKAQTVTCEECNNYVFSSVIVVKRISPLISPSGEEVIVPVQTYQCSKCEHINAQFLPDNALTDIER